MQTIAVVGLDLAKTVFQVHGVATDGTVVVRRQLRRGQVLAFFQSIGPCLIGIEACASAHHWARELMAIGREMLEHPVEPLPGVAETLERLRAADHRLVMITKGDLLDQEQKVARSGLAELFDAVEIVSEKTAATFIEGATCPSTRPSSPARATSSPTRMISLSWLSE